MVLCSICSKRESVVRIYYDKTDLCKACFCLRFEKRVMKANREFNLLKRGDVVAVGISGGKDSAAMLYVLSKMTKKIGGITLKPILIDEGIQGYRNEAMEKAKELCDSLKLPLQVFSYKKEFGLSMDEAIKSRDEKKLSNKSCSFCGVFRKSLLNKAARAAGANKAAIGHNADDIGQTFLMNLMRSDVKRLKKFGAVSGLFEQDLFVKRIKPLIYNTERECALYCSLKNLPFYLGECPYSSESFRGLVKDFLNTAEQKHPGTKFAVLNSFLSLQEELDTPEKQEPKKCIKCGENTSSETCKACSFSKLLT